MQEIPTLLTDSSTVTFISLNATSQLVSLAHRTFLQPWSTTNRHCNPAHKLPPTLRYVS